MTTGLVALATTGVGLVASMGLRLTPVSQVTPEFGREIDAYATYERQEACDPTPKPGVVAVKDLLNETFGKRSWGIDRACDQGGTSEHKEGRALDYMLDVNNPAQRKTAQDIVDWLLATDEHGNAHAVARRLGVMYIIWNNQTWKAFQPKLGWQPRACDGSPNDCHTNHIHISFSRLGALKQTSWWKAAPAAPTPTPTSAPTPADVTAVLAPDGHPWVFGRSADNTLHQWYESGDGWLESSLGGSLAGAATAVRSPEAVWVFGRGADNTLRHWHYLHGTWTEGSLGGSLAGDPAVALAPNGSPWVFGRAADNTLHHWYFEAGKWQERSLGGWLAGDPAVVLTGEGIPWVFGRTPNNSLHQWYRVLGEWADRELGGQLEGDLAAVTAPDGSPWLFGRAPDGTLSQWYFGSATISSRGLGGSLAGEATVVKAPDGTPWVFGRAANNMVHRWYYAGGSWVDYSLGGELQGDVAALAGDGGQPMLFGRDKDGKLRQWYFTDRWVAIPAPAPTVHSGQTVSPSAPPAPAAR